MRSTQTVHIFNLDAAAKAVSTFTFSTESYGQSGIAVFRELAAAEGVCVSREEALRAQPTNEVPLCALSGVCSSDIHIIRNDSVCCTGGGQRVAASAVGCYITCCGVLVRGSYGARVTSRGAATDWR